MADTVRNLIPVCVVGCDFRVASSASRGVLTTTVADRSSLCAALRRLDETAGFAALETCNRNEWIVSTDQPQWLADLLSAQMVSRWQSTLPDGAVIPTPYWFINEDAVRHLLRVVVGYESLALGEAQVAGQFQRAIKRAQHEDASSPVLNALGAIAGRLAKAGHEIGFRANRRQGIHGLVAHYLRTGTDQAALRKTVLVVGMGEIGRKIASLLEEWLGYSVIRFNRTVTAKHQNVWQPLSAVLDYLPQADAMVVATSSCSPLFTAAAFRNLHRPQPLEVVDVGIPPQVNLEGESLTTVRYATVDDLVHAEANQEAATYLQLMDKKIETALSRFRRFCLERNLVFLLEALHQRRQFFLDQFIPVFADRHLADFDDRTRKTMEEAFKHLIREYSNDVFNAIHRILEGSGGDE